MMKFTTLLAMAALLALSGIGREQAAASRGAVLNEASVNRSTPASSFQTPCVPTPSGMVSWWPGDGNAMDIANGNHGTLQNGATSAPGRVAQAFALDGVDDYIQFGDILDGLNGGFTLDAWIQTTSTVGNKAIIAKHWTTGGSWAIRTNEFDPRKVDLTVCSPDCATLAADAVQLVSTSNINDGAWHFIAATFDGTTQRLYIDGALEASGTNTNPAWTDNHHFCIGSFCDPGGNSFLTFGGLIDEVEIYNRALSASEIAAIFNAGSAGKCKFLAVDIDIKPGSFPNSINLGSYGVIPVAILSTPIFNAATVNSSTVRFGANGTEAAPVQTALQDVDGDGDLDRILHFRTQSTGITCGATSASLSGQTFNGQAIKGTDSVRTVGCN
jgi:hypothetical protein